MSTPWACFTFIHESAHVSRHGEHAQRVQAAVEHVVLMPTSLNGFREGTHGLVGVLTIKEIHLFKSAAVCFHAGKATHLDDYRCNTLQLVFFGAGTYRYFEHVSIDKTELNLTFWS